MLLYLAAVSHFAPERIFALAAALDERERSTAASLRDERDRASRMLSAALLRAVLAPFAGQPPDALRFERSAQGKPHLAAGAAGVHFNLSHTRELIAIAVAGMEVGVDAEAVRPALDWEEVAGQYLAPGELAWCSAAPGGDAAARFCSLWTVKEAVVKASGEGIARVREVAVEPSGEAGLAVEAFGQSFQVAVFAPVPAHRVAVASAASRPLRVLPFQLTPACAAVPLELEPLLWG